MSDLVIRSSESVLFLALACVFIYKSVTSAFDFYYITTKNISELRRLFVSVLGTLAGFASSIALLHLTLAK